MEEVTLLRKNTPNWALAVRNDTQIDDNQLPNKVPPT